jgi:hypothetical protein
MVVMIKMERDLGFRVRVQYLGLQHPCLRRYGIATSGHTCVAEDWRTVRGVGIIRKRRFSIV